MRVCRVSEDGVREGAEDKTAKVEELAGYNLSDCRELVLVGKGTGNS